MTFVATILLTGASGMIGQYLTSSLLHKKHRVFAIDTKSNEYIGQDPNYTFIQCEITDKDAISSVMTSNHIDVVVHLGCSVDNDLDP